MILELAYAIVLTVLGLAAGCWLTRRSLRAARHSREQTRQARTILTNIGVVTTRVAADIDTHNHRVRHINDELTAEGASDHDGIASTIAKLVAANQDLQQRLVEADARLREQSQQLDIHVAEARTDILTRLPNRRAFDAEAARRYAEFARTGTPFSVILLDLDHFESINGKYGRQVGDELLRAVASALLRAARMVDLPARYGGDAFAILLPGTAVAEAREVAKRHQQAIGTVSLLCGDHAVSVTASAGVAQIMPGEHVETTLRRGERALYLAKQAGRNTSLWHDGRAVHSNLASGDEDGSPAAAETHDEPDAYMPSTPAAPSPPPDLAEMQAGQPRGPLGKPLTNECDRTVFVWQVRQGIAQWKRDGEGFSVMLVQVDEYDRLKKTHGEAVAEIALRAARLLLGASVREMDVVGHYGPSCFSVLLPRTRLPEALAVAERVRSGATQCLIPTETGSLEVAMRIALAEVSEGDDVLHLFRRAEAALSMVGRNGTCCHNGRSAEMVEAPVDPRVSASAADSCAATSGESQPPCAPILNARTR